MADPRRTLPRFSRILWRTLMTPATIYFAAIGNLVLALAVVGFHWFEREENPGVDSWFDSLWWGFATVTTVGFGDVVPVTDAGRVIGMVLMVTGVSFFVGFTALVASGFYGRLEAEIQATERLTYREYERVMGELARISQRLEGLEAMLARERGGEPQPSPASRGSGETKE